MCPFNKSVDCDKDKHCETCGWNPEVDAQRRAIIRERIQSEPPEVKETWHIGSGEYKKM